MKEQILQLDPHDDYHAARDKIGWAQTDRLLLVWPQRGRGRLFQRQLDLLLVQRHAARLGAKLALVTDDPIVCDHAGTLGIPVFDSVDDSHLRPWRSRRPLPPTRRPQPELLDADPVESQPIFTLPRPAFLQSPALRRAASAVMFLIAFSAIGVMLTLAVPGARITLTPQAQTIAAAVSIAADANRNEIDLDAKIIPAKILSVVVANSAEVATTGAVDEATERAGGRVTFTNLTSQPVRIPAGTAVRTTGGAPVRFVTQKDVMLEPQRGAAGEAPVLAIEPGPLGNVGAGLINSIEGPLAVQAAVINIGPTRGGEVKQVATATDEDRQRLKEMLLAELKQQGYAELLAQLSEHQFAPAATVQVLDILDETYDRFAGEKADRLKLEMRAKIAATVVDERDAFAVGQAEIESRLGRSLVIAPDTLAFSRAEPTTVDDDGRIRFDITAKAQANASIDPDAVRNAARWLPLASAADKLYKDFPVLTRPVIELWPSWFGRVPWLAWRIEVVLEPER